jgi:hypothetical protein
LRTFEAGYKRAASRDLRRKKKEGEGIQKFSDLIIKHRRGNGGETE